MILSLWEIEKMYNIKGHGVIHVGAHHGEEYEAYLKYGIKDMIFFEPVAYNFAQLKKNISEDDNIKLFNLAIGNDTCERKMYIETRNDRNSCSILEPYIVSDMYPWITFDSFETVHLDKLDNIEFDRNLFNVLNIDVQGYELEVLKGAVNTLKHIDILYIELNAVEMYEGCGLVSDIDEFLIDMTRVIDNINVNGRWGDGLYIKNDYL